MWAKTQQLWEKAAFAAFMSGFSPFLNVSTVNNLTPNSLIPEVFRGVSILL
jgi:hypothetical protein